MSYICVITWYITLHDKIHSAEYEDRYFALHVLTIKNKPDTPEKRINSDNKSHKLLDRLLLSSTIIL